MILPPEVLGFISAQGWGRVLAATPLGGGCISTALRLVTERGPAALLKLNPEAPPDMFAREAEGLATLRLPAAPRVPQVLEHGGGWILLEFIPGAPRARRFSGLLGEQLAALHLVTHGQFGFWHDNYLGLTPQPNPWTADGHAFFAESRLLPQARRAREGGLISQEDARDLEHLAALLPSLIPSQPASLLHGDLWAGNLLAGPAGEPVVVDPAAHFGWAEAELGMMTLFGGFDAAVFEAYASTRPLAAGWRGRLDLYNLYHLLNHLNLFGPGYYGQVRRILDVYLRRRRE